MRNPFAFPLSRQQHFAGENEDQPGLILVQLDGLSLPRFEAELAEDKLPFLRSLLAGPSYQLHSMEPGTCCCTSCPLVVASSATPAADEGTPGRPPLLRVKYNVGETPRRLFSWPQFFDGRLTIRGRLARLDRAVARLVKSASRGSRRYDLWVHARHAFAILPVDAPLPRCCADEGTPLKPADLRVTFEQFQNGLAVQTAPHGRPARSRRARVLRVLSYDVHSCLGMDGRWSPARIAQVIRQSGADVVCLQNLDVGYRSTGENQAKWIASLLQGASRSSPGERDHRTWNVKLDRYGNAVLSRFAMRLVRTGIAAANDVETLRRSILWVQVDAYGDTPVQFLNSHPLRNSGRLEAESAAPSSVAQWIAAAASRGTTILCGDGTSDANSLASRTVAAQLVDSTVHPLSRINHVFSTDELTLHSAGIIATPLAKIASDHLPVRVGFCVA